MYIISVFFQEDPVSSVKSAECSLNVVWTLLNTKVIGISTFFTQVKEPPLIAVQACETIVSGVGYFIRSVPHGGLAPAKQTSWV